MGLAVDEHVEVRVAMGLQVLAHRRLEAGRRSAVPACVPVCVPVWLLRGHRGEWRAVPVTTPEPVERATRIVLRPLANPLPLGFLALAGGTFVLGAHQLGWIAPAEGANVALVLLAFVAPLQLATSVLGFLARDAVAGTGMGILAGTWASVGLVLFRSPPGSTSDAIGFLLLAAAAAMCIPAAGAATAKLVPAAVLGTAAARFLVTGLFQVTGEEGWKDAAGWIGVALAVLATYAAAAMLLEDVRGTTLPVLRHDAGRRAVDGHLEDQLAQLDTEAGVREQL